MVRYVQSSYICILSRGSLGYFGLLTSMIIGSWDSSPCNDGLGESCLLRYVYLLFLVFIMGG